MNQLTAKKQIVNVRETEVTVTVWEDVVRGRFAMDIPIIRKLAAEVAQKAYEQMVAEHKIADHYTLVNVKPKTPGSGSFAEFVDVHMPEFRGYRRFES